MQLCSAVVCLRIALLDVHLIFSIKDIWFKSNSYCQFILINQKFYVHRMSHLVATV